MRNSKPWHFGPGVLLAVALGTGCTATPPLAPQTRVATIQNRVTAGFTNAVLFKPKESGLDQPLAVQLAPLLIWDARTPPPAAARALTVQAGITLLNNRWHRQFTYQWNNQGIRVTLDSADAPVIWEILRDSTGAEIIYVAQSLELAALREFGPTLPPRKFSIERSLAESPDIVVANVIADGPVPMGPILYLQADNLDVTALICRCMPAQFKNLLATQEYELGQLNPPGSRPSNGFPAKPLDQRLRLPRQF
jgi:hypothetical protein